VSRSVRVIFLGGIGEVGKNMLALETDDDIIIVDCGLGFPEEDQPGIDLLLPDVSYLRERVEKIRGIFITHGHEDHIGGLPYLWAEIPVPIHATRLTAGLIKVKMREASLMDRVEIHEFDPDTRPRLTAGDFTLEPFRVSHSIPDAVGFGITTPAGLIVLTGDFKFDPTPIDGRTTDIALLTEFGDRGVHALISDCVHVEVPGHTPSERVVGDTYEEVFASAPGRIIIATFASLIARLQQVIDTASRHGRKVATLGRSLENNVRVARELGYLTDPDEILLPAKQAASLPDNEIVYIVTGSQGEPMAVLSRIANRDHAHIQVGEGDTVIVSATPIPGNETSVFRIINQLFQSGAEVIYSSRALVHVSGHASREELARMIELTRPRYLIPTHGEPRHLALYADMAVELGIPRGRVTLANLGDVLVVDERGVGVEEQLPIEYVYVEGRAVGQVNDDVLRDRQSLSRDGMVTIAVSIDRETGEVLSGPKVLTRGFTRTHNGVDLVGGLTDELRAVLASGDGDLSVGRKIRETAASYLFSRTRRRPTIIPIVLDV
jgi:ribonuclease J